MKNEFWWEGMKKDITNFVGNYSLCSQRKKTAAKQYGTLPGKSESDIEIRPWFKVYPDTIGPWAVPILDPNAPQSDPTRKIDSKRI